MKTNKKFKRQKTIKKPNWLISFLTCTLIFSVLGIFIWNISVYSFQELLYFRSDDEYISTYISEIARYGGDGFTDEELDIIANKLALRQAVYHLPAIITVDDQELCNSTYAMTALVSNSDSDSSEFYVIHWDPNQDTNVQKLLDYQDTISLTAGYLLDVLDYYVDADTHTLYIGKVKVTKVSGFSVIFGFYGSADFGTTEDYDVVDITPADTSVLEGLTHVDNDLEYDRSLNVFFITGGVENGDVIDTPDYVFGTTPHHVHAQYDDSFNNNMRRYLGRVYAWIVAFFAVVLSLICGTIWYFRKKSTYDIFEYRRKTTNAMAHDLKTPLAIASLSVANLRENLGVNNDRVEHHANEIDESISYMDKLICNILEFSNSESVDRKLKRENVDVKAELESYKQEISKVLEDADMKLEISGEATRVTDKKIWNQAITNLIDNTIKYGSKGSTITVNLGPKEITITNNVDEDVLNVESLKEPFAKGANSRGENSGSGLGLSIADNNLTALGYKLKLDCKDRKFTVTIC